MRTVRPVVIATFALTLAALAAAPALAGRGLVVGVNEDAVKWRPDISSIGSNLNLGYYRVTQGWEPGRTQPSDSDTASIAAALANAGSQKILLNVFASANTAPRNASARADYCGFVSSVLDRFPQIAAVNIWNEANLGFFWKPQFTSKGSSAAPADYEALMARCYDTIKSRHPSVRVITSISPRGNDRPHASSNVSHSAKNFIEKMGQAYRRSHRRARIFDAWGQNVYGSNSKERPWTRHRLDIGEGDYPRLLSYLRRAFGGTRQPVPGQKDVRIWYLEDGFQTSVAAKRILYFGNETDHPVTPVPTASRLDQASQLTDAVRLAYCQGVFFSDWTPKPSYEALKSVIAEVDAGRVNCTKLRTRIKRLGG